MILMALLIVLGIERVAATSNIWQLEYYYKQYQPILDNVTNKDYFNHENQWKLYVWLTVPSIVLYYLIAGLGSGLFELIIITAILLITVGCSQRRLFYRDYLRSSNNGDGEGAAIYAEKLGQNFSDEKDTLGKALVWLNFVHYFGVVFWFVLLSAPGALFYALCHKFFDKLKEQDKKHMQLLIHFIDWIPARLVSVGFMFVGNFANALPLWLSYFFDVKTPAKHVITEIAKAADDTQSEGPNCTKEPCAMVRLAKRNILFFLCIISILTIYGWLQ